MKLKNLAQSTFLAVFSSLATLLAYQSLTSPTPQVVFEEVSSQANDSQDLITLTKKGKHPISGEETPVDFTEAAEKTTSSVVHIVSTQNVQARSRNEMPDMFRDFFGDDFGREFFRGRPRGAQPAQASGSGVILSQDGYIVTNNHVVDNASEVEVILNNQQTYKARVIGTDPSTDLAVIKIEAFGLPNIVLGNSDEVKVGQWVLAVGNPFSLESTVTAGIVSAKGRNLDILRNRDQAPIESFIQTDAAVNPGNSGGALVNTNGDLIGINTAIATPTGTYAGYSFAVPVNIVRKVTKDLIEYGEVQRAYLGITIRQLDGNLAKEKGLKDISEGVYVETVNPESAAEEAGLKAGDVIIRIGNKDIKSSPELLEEIAKRRPGNQVEVEVLRDGKNKTFEVFLKDKLGGTELVSNKGGNVNLMRELGVEFEDLKPEELKELGISQGVRVGRLYDGKLRRETDIREGFIITKIGDEPVKSAQELTEKLQNSKGGVFFTGVYPDYEGEFYYAFGM